MRSWTHDTRMTPVGAAGTEDNVGAKGQRDVIGKTSTRRRAFKHTTARTGAPVTASAAGTSVQVTAEHIGCCASRGAEGWLQRNPHKRAWSRHRHAQPAPCAGAGGTDRTAHCRVKRYDGGNDRIGEKACTDTSRGAVCASSAERAASLKHRYHAVSRGLNR